MTILFLVCKEPGIFVLCNSSGLLDCNVLVRSWLRHCASSRQVAGSIPDYVLGNFYCLWHWPHCGSGVDSASNRNEYQEYFLGGKGGRCVGLTTLPPSYTDCHEIWEPEPPGTLRNCNRLVRGLLYLLLLSNSTYLLFFKIKLLLLSTGAWDGIVAKALRYWSEGPGIDSTGFFSDISPSDRTMALGSTQPLVKLSTRNIPGGKGGRCVRLTTSPLSYAECHENLGA
jgi:hypothetical protein